MDKNGGGQGRVLSSGALCRVLSLSVGTVFLAPAVSPLTQPLARLIQQFERLPGIGPRTAQRLSLHLLRQPQEQLEAFAEALLTAKRCVGQCEQCFHLATAPLCDICRDQRRLQNQICVVAESRDLLALERSGEFHGVYHVLGGVISPMDGVTPDMLTVQALIQRISRNPIEEVILALTPSVEGDTTSLYLAGLIQPFCPVSRIAYGLPMGSELEFADAVTLARALEGRRRMG